MRIRFSRVVVLAGFLLGVGCSNGPACVIDTDCPLGQLCSDGHCQERGGDVDAAAQPDSGRTDSGSGDGGGVDAGAGDAGEEDQDTGPEACTSTTGSYTLSTSPAACPTIIAAFDVGAGTTECEIVVSAREEATFGGTMTSTGGSSFSGALSIGASSYPDCTLTFGRGSATIDCGGGCTLSGSLP